MKVTQSYVYKMKGTRLIQLLADSKSIDLIVLPGKTDITLKMEITQES